MKYAVIRLSGRQYKISEKQEILLDHVPDAKVSPEVLLVVDEEKVKIGKPTVSGSKVELKFLEEVKGEKIDVVKYKAKSRYRKKRGFRPVYSKFQVEKIT